MNLVEELDKLNLTHTLIDNSPALVDFCNNADFIESTLSVLNSDNISYKKNYFIDNQEDITDCISNMKSILLNIDISKNHAFGEELSVLNSLEKIINIYIKRLENGMNKFQEELKNNMTKNTDIEISKEAILDAMQNNEGTKEINKNLQDMINQKEIISDEYTEKMRKDFDNLMNNKSKARNKTTGSFYVIAESDMSIYEMVHVKNDSKTELNKLLENANLKNPRLFKLTEIPTTSQVVQRVVTIVK